MRSVCAASSLAFSGRTEDGEGNRFEIDNTQTELTKEIGEPELYRGVAGWFVVPGVLLIRGCMCVRCEAAHIRRVGWSIIADVRC